MTTPSTTFPNARRVGIVMLLAAGAAALVLLAASPPARAGAALQTGSEYAEIYAQQCAACHGDQGEGGVGGALTDSSLDIEGRIAIITNGQGGMPSYGPTLTTNQIEGVAFLLDDLAIGAVYAQQCAACHGAGGEGASGPSLQTSSMTEEARLAIIADGSPAMPGYSQTLSEDEIQDLADFIAGFVAADTTGEEIWTSQCGPCHGAAGEGAVAESILDTTTSFEDIVLFVTNGGGAMPAFGPTLSPEEIRAVSSYTESLRTTPPDDGPDSTDTPGGDGAGAGIYDINCSACHGADGSGGAGPPLTGTTLSAAELEAAIASGVGSMPGFGELLAPEDVTAVASFVAGLAGGGGSEGSSGDGDIAPVALGAAVYTEYCAPCHGPDASGGSALALKDSTLSAAELETAIVGGAGTMSGFGDMLTNEEVAATVAFLEARIAAEGGEPSPSGSTLPPEDSSGIIDAVGGLSPGRDVYASSCATCHGAFGEGGVGSSLINTNLTVNEIVSRIYGGHEDGMPAFEGVLDPNDVQSVARFVVELEGDEEQSSSGFVPVLITLAVAAAVIIGLVYLWRSGWMRSARRT